MKYLCAALLTLLFSHLSFAQDGMPTSIHPLARLTDREPTLQQIEAYLFANPPEPVGERPYNQGFFHGENNEFCGFHWKSDIEPFTYIDLNGDDALDLVVEGIQHVAAMVWTGEEYSQPFQLYFCNGIRNPWSQIELDDWTNDGIAEVVFDHRIAYGGTGVRDEIWRRYIIHCDDIICQLAWEGESGEFRYVSDYIDGMMLRETQFIRHDNGVNPQFETVSYEFAFNCTYPCTLNYDLPVPEGEVIQPDGFRVGGVILTDYVWDGVYFAVVNERILSEPSHMEIPTQFTAEYNGRIASVVTSWVDVDRFRQHLQCQIMLDDRAIGAPFLCLFPFADWRDVTGDGNLELVVTAYSGRYGVHDNEKDCAHQRLLIFEIDEETIHQLANIIGCIWRPDLFGIRLENVDADASLEIIAGGQRMTPTPQSCRGGYCWYELNDYDDVYNWNGESFEPTDSMLRTPYGGE